MTKLQLSLGLCRCTALHHGTVSQGLHVCLISRLGQCFWAEALVSRSSATLHMWYCSSDRLTFCVHNTRWFRCGGNQGCWGTSNLLGKFVQPSLLHAGPGVLVRLSRSFGQDAGGGTNASRGILQVPPIFLACASLACFISGRNPACRR